MMKTISLLLLLVVCPVAFAEGIASMTDVTAANAKSLAHHGLSVICKSQRGKTFVDVTVRPEKSTPFAGCSVTIYDTKGGPLVQFDPAIHVAPQENGLPPGSRVYFHVADELVDDVEVRYHLESNGTQTHVFTIKRGDLRKLADLAK